jgi:hypothetical protein
MVLKKRITKVFDSKGKWYERTIVDDIDPKYPLGSKRIKDTLKKLR